MELIKDLLILILPSLLTAVFSWLGIDKIKLQRYQRLIEIAEEAEEKVRIAYQALTTEASTEQFSKAVGGGVIRREVKERLLQVERI